MECLVLELDVSLQIPTVKSTYQCYWKWRIFFW